MFTPVFLARLLYCHALFMDLKGCAKMAILRTHRRKGRLHVPTIQPHHCMIVLHDCTLDTTLHDNTERTLSQCKDHQVRDRNSFHQTTCSTFVGSHRAETSAKSNTRDPRWVGTAQIHLGVSIHKQKRVTGVVLQADPGKWTGDECTQWCARTVKRHYHWSPK